MNKVSKEKKIEIFNNLILLCILLIFLLIMFYCGYKILNTPNLVSDLFYKIGFFSCFICFLFFLIVIIKFNTDLKIIVSIVSISIVFSLYSFELYLQFLYKDYKTIYIEKNNIQYDERSNLEVINDLSKKGILAYPNIKPLMFRETNGLLDKSGFRIYPISGISNITVVNCNEGGFWSILKSDEKGFLNPHGLISKKNQEILLVGDSLAEGSCVNQENTIAGKLREKGITAITLGKSGNGPLVELASLIEYGKFLKPKSVFWLFYQNDIENLMMEKNSKILKNYLNHGFSQNLINRQEEINEILIEYYNKKLLRLKEKNTDLEFNIVNELINEKQIRLNSKLFKILKLYNFRIMFNLIPQQQNTEPPPILSDIIKKSKRIVNSWGGEFYFVYLPVERYFLNKKYKNYNKIKYMVEKLDIEFIDIHEEAFKDVQNKLSIFPLEMHNHYNEYGYSLIAEVLAKKYNKVK